MKLKTRPFLSAFFSSLLLAFSAYVFILQTPAFSKPRAAAAAALWLILFSGIWFLQKKPGLLTRPHLPGILAIFLLVNLILAAVLSRIPYFNLLLPAQTVQITPLSADGAVNILTFDSENEQGIGVTHFAAYEGWGGEERQITRLKGETRALVWQGKPGQFVQIQFSTCPQCGPVRIDIPGAASQEVDLSQPAATDSTYTFRFDFPSLWFHQLLVFLALELSLLLLSAGLLWSFKWLAACFSKPAGTHATLPAGAVQSKTLLPLLALTLFTVINYGLKIEPILFNDDWCQIVNALHTHSLGGFMATERRPLHLFLAWLCSRFLPLDQTILALSVLNVVLLILTAAVTYLLLHRLFNGQDWAAFLLTLLWLVFPNDYTRLYISMLGVRSGYLLVLVVMLLTVKQAQTEDRYSGLISGLLLFLSLLMYEGHLGLALVCPPLVLWFYRLKFTQKRLAGFAEYYLGIALFVVWRLVIQPAYFYRDTKLDYLELNAGVLLGRIGQAFRTVLGGFFYPYLAQPWLTLPDVLILAALLAGCGVFFWSLRRTISHSSSGAGPAGALPDNVRLMTAGFMLWLAGYFPILLNYAPNIYGHLSRVNLFSILGAALFLLALIRVLGLSLFADETQANRLALGLLMPLVFLGSVIQVHVQESYNRSWEEAKGFYQALFEQVPAVQKDTQVALLLNGYEELDITHRPLYSSNWEAPCAFQTLYDQPTIRMGYRYKKIAVPPFQTLDILAGAMDKDTLGKVADPSRLLVLAYDYPTRQLTIQRDIRDVFGNEVAQKYAPDALILPLTDPISSRSLVK